MAQELGTERVWGWKHMANGLSRLGHSVFQWPREVGGRGGRLLGSGNFFVPRSDIDLGGRVVSGIVRGRAFLGSAEASAEEIPSPPC